VRGRDAAWGPARSGVEQERRSGVEQERRSTDAGWASRRASPLRSTETAAPPLMTGLRRADAAPARPATHRHAGRSVQSARSPDRSPDRSSGGGPGSAPGRGRRARAAAEPKHRCLRGSASAARRPQYRGCLGDGGSSRARRGRTSARNPAERAAAFPSNRHAERHCQVVPSRTLLRGAGTPRTARSHGHRPNRLIAENGLCLYRRTNHSSATTAPRP
jgi:hypothetical protein